MRTIAAGSSVSLAGTTAPMDHGSSPASRAGTSGKRAFTLLAALAALVVGCVSAPDASSSPSPDSSTTATGGSTSGIVGTRAMSGGRSALLRDPTRATGGSSQATDGSRTATGGRSANTGGAATATGGRLASIGGGNPDEGGATTAEPATGGREAGTTAAGGRATGGTTTGSSARGGSATTTGGSAPSTNVGGTGACDVSEPPANVAAWIDESWNAEGKNNMSWHKTWLHDAAIRGQGEINICVRYGATQAVTTATRDLIASSMQRWFNKWFAKLYQYHCFPYPSVTVKVTGWAVKPGQESLLQWTVGDVPIYTEVSDGADQAKGEPKCPDTCGFFFHPDHAFTNCPGGASNHFDYTLWLNDKLPSGAAAEGSDWGVRIPVAAFIKELKTDDFGVMLHEMGHGFGLSDYYTWKGSTPTGGSVMFAGSAGVLTTGDQWIVRRYWKETKALRYP